MKKKTSLLLAIILLMTSICGCGSNKISGKVAQREVQDPEGNYILVGVEDKTDATKIIGYQFQITENTEIIWKDDAVKELLEIEFVEDDLDVLFGGGHEVTITIGEPLEGELSEYATEIYEAKKIVITDVNEDCFCLSYDKPVIYLYPEEKIDVSVILDFDGKLTCTYPKYDEGWQVIADPDGTLTDKEGQTYNYLYWEGEQDWDYNITNGFCVKGEDTAEFLEDALDKLGLSRREANEFIIYWLPKMENNAYNLIAFQEDEYTERAKLTINPFPDTVIRVYMTWKSLEEPVEIEPQELKAPERNGFTVVEWGGSELN